MSDLAGFLGTVGIFSLLSSDEAARVAGYLDPVQLASGDVLFREGDPGDNLYIIRSGRIRIGIRLPDGSEHRIAELTSGDFLGEMSIFDHAPRSATCRALEAASLLALTRDEFEAIVAEHPQIALKLMYRMLNVATQRLRDTGEIASDMVLWGEGAQKRAVTDELTGAYNRRFLEDSLDGYVAEAAEKGRPLSLAMVDLDHFREINERHGLEKADGIIKAVVGLFRTLLGPSAVVARYGGDEFVLILPGLDTDAAAAALARVCAGIAGFDALTAADGSVTRVTASMGVASYPADAPDVATLRTTADAALYQAKEGGRNRVVPAGCRAAVLPVGVEAAPPRKTPPRTIKEKNDTIANVIAAITRRHRFLLLGHQSPDDDCIASMVSFALLLRLFTRQAAIYFGAEPHEHFHYLLDICRFNGIRILLPGNPLPAGIEAIVACDTPKPAMIEASEPVRELIGRPDVLRIEIDHHFGADSGFFGDPGYRLVAEASASCELIGHLLMKLQHRHDLLERFQVADLFPRNLVLAILTGIIGDSQMGKYLKTRRERRYYEVFSAKIQRAAQPLDGEEVQLLHHGRGVQRAAEAVGRRRALLRGAVLAPAHRGVDRRGGVLRGGHGAPVRRLRRRNGGDHLPVGGGPARGGQRPARPRGLPRQPRAQRPRAVPSAPVEPVQGLRPAQPARPAGHRERRRPRGSHRVSRAAR